MRRAGRFRHCFDAGNKESGKLAEAMDRLFELEEQASAKQHERALHEASGDAVVEALPDGLIVTGAAGKIVAFNQEAEFMFGYHRNEVIGKAGGKLMLEYLRGRHTHDRELYYRLDLSQRARHLGAMGANLVGTHGDGDECLTDITLARMIVPKRVFNLAPVRCSARAVDPDVAAHFTAETKSDQNATPDIDESDAGR